MKALDFSRDTNSPLVSGLPALPLFPPPKEQEVKTKEVADNKRTILFIISFYILF